MHTQTKTQWQFYKELELLPDSIPAPKVTYPGITSWLGQIWENLLEAMFKQPEPKVWSSINGAGDVWWHAYNPLTGQTTHFGSEDEVLVWLEQYPYILTKRLQQ